MVRGPFGNSAQRCSIPKTGCTARDNAAKLVPKRCQFAKIDHAICCNLRRQQHPAICDAAGYGFFLVNRHQQEEPASNNLAPTIL